MSRWLRRPLALCARRGASAGPGAEPPPLPPPRGPGAERRLRAAEQLQLLGLSAEAAARALRAWPDVLRVPAPQLEARAACLRRLGLDRGRLQRVLGRCPQLLSLPRKQLEAAERLLRERCRFTAPQLSALLHACPGALLCAPPALHLHFQYAYFRMGLRHEAMVKGRLFCTPFAELRRRHGFLERRGLYRAPRKGLEHPQNPPLKDVLHLPEDAFLASVARATPHEYEVFKKLLAREEEEEEREDEEEDDEEEDDDDDRDVLFAEEDEDLGSEGSRS